MVRREEQILLCHVGACSAATRCQTYLWAKLGSATLSIGIQKGLCLNLDAIQ